MILLDYLLPHMNGLDLYAHKPLKDIPVMIISANLPRKEVNRRHLICLQKPFELDILLTTVKNVLMDKEEL